MTANRKALILLAFLLVSCRASAPVSTAPAAAPAPPPAPAVRQTHELLNSVLWIQASTEYRAACIGTFVAAQRMIDVALNDRSWTAAVEQQGDASALPPAIIVDVDETVLDNAAYEARLIRSGGAFEYKTWNAWVNEARAGAVPGAVEFAKYAAARGVTTFYITNRTGDIEAATLRNLQSVGFPIAEGTDVLLTRNEKPEWAAGDKTSRRAHVAASYRVILVIGDNLGDFIADENIPLDQRLAAADTYRDRWGKSWFMIPNPMYGTWESAVLGYQRGLPDADQLTRKREALDTRP